MKSESLKESPELPRVTLHHLSKQERKKLRADSPLQYTLHTLGIPHFRRGSIERYMEDRIDELHHPRPIMVMERQFDGRFLLAGGILALLIIPLNFIFPSLDETRTCGYALVAIFLVVLSGIRRKMEVQHWPLRRPYAHWSTCSLEVYRGYCKYDMQKQYSPVPESILATVEVIKAELPDAEFNVHYLLDDPILEIIHYPKHGRSSTEYIAVWDEKGFVY